MKRITLLKNIGFMSALLLANSAFSQKETKVVADTTKTNALEEVFVTGVVNPKTKIKSSVSITTLGIKQIEQSAPRSTAEIFRSIPGIRSESTGGEGNANIAVRGVPISSGGSKYLQLQEDGLPVLLFGDIAFATADIFTRFDGNVARIEAIRGGSASVLSSNSPGGIINFISKTGKVEGGTMSTSFGLDYNNFRTDIDYGAKIGDGLYFHAGGFYRAGEGVRNVGFTANNGGQAKFNITKEFEKGSVTIYAKFLNDRAAAYMPMPVQVSGTNANPTWGNVPGFNATKGALQSVFLSHNVGLGPDGQLRRGKVADGMNPISKSLGVNAAFDLEGGWKISESGRFTANSGGFISPFPSEVGTASAIANSFGAGSTLSYANSGTPFNTANGLVARIHMFDTQLNDFNNFMNDLKVTKKFEKVGVTAGFFKSIQNISMSWLWNSYLQEVSDSNPRLLNVTNATGGSLSDNGLYAYGTPYWGNLARNYDTQYNVSAPYANVSFDANDKLSFEGGIRFDMGKVTGSFAGGSSSQYDINNDGIISAPESNVFAVNTANTTAVNYDYNYTSYSVGANYLVSDNQSFFARYSKGASAKADRILFERPKASYLNGDLINSLDYLAQAELGYKRKFSKGYVYGTFFYAKTDEQSGFEATNPTVLTQNNYKSLGLELETAYNVSKDFDLRGGLTYTKAEITSGANAGNAPRRQPKLMYSFIPTYKFSKTNSLGLSFLGQSKAFAQDSNQLVMNGFVLINGFVEIGITKGLSLNVSGNNLLDTLAITEVEEGSITENTVNYVRARPFAGRSLSMALTYRF
ncbi:CirA Outer membrane receptor proteins, mostly Fe transport [Flavobacteriaceae bacterium]